jgi:hypothetical protein
MATMTDGSARTPEHAISVVRAESTGDEAVAGLVKIQ